MIPRRTLSPKEIGMGYIISLRILTQPLVFGQDVQRVHMLALIFVHALNLHIENGIGVQGNAIGFFHIRGQLFLICPLNFLHTAENRSIVLIGQ